MNKLILYIKNNKDKIAVHGFKLTTEKIKGVQTLPSYLITENGYKLKKEFDKEKEVEYFPEYYIDGIINLNGKDFKELIDKQLKKEFEVDEIAVFKVEDVGDIFLTSILDMYLNSHIKSLKKTSPVKYWSEDKHIDDVIDDNRKIFIFDGYDPNELVLINYKEDLDVTKINTKGQRKHHYNEVGKVEAGRRFTLWMPKEEPKYIRELFDFFQKFKEGPEYPIIIDLGVLFVKNNFRMFKVFGLEALTHRIFRDGYQILINNTPLVYEPKPVVATKLVIDYVKGFKEHIKKGSYIDITGVIYAPNKKGVLTFREEIKDRFNAYIETKYKNQVKKGIALFLIGSDTLSRNHLKRIGKDLEKVEAVYMTKDKGAFIEYLLKFTFKDGSIALSSSLFTNKIFVTALI